MHSAFLWKQEWRRCEEMIMLIKSLVSTAPQKGLQRNAFLQTWAALSNTWVYKIREAKETVHCRAWLQQCAALDVLYVEKNSIFTRRGTLGVRSGPLQGCISLWLCSGDWSVWLRGYGDLTWSGLIEREQKTSEAFYCKPPFILFSGETLQTPPRSVRRSWNSCQGGNGFHPLKHIIWSHGTPLCQSMACAGEDKSQKVRPWSAGALLPSHTGSTDSHPWHGAPLLPACLPACLSVRSTCRRSGRLSGPRDLLSWWWSYPNGLGQPQQTCSLRRKPSAPCSCSTVSEHAVQEITHFLKCKFLSEHRSQLVAVQPVDVLSLS